MTGLRQLSDREQERQELAGNRAQSAVDDIDARWPDVCAAAALASDCFKALKETGNFTEEQALTLVGPLMEHLK